MYTWICGFDFHLFLQYCTILYALFYNLLSQFIWLCLEVNRYRDNPSEIPAYNYTVWTLYTWTHVFQPFPYWQRVRLLPLSLCAQCCNKHPGARFRTSCCNKVYKRVSQNGIAESKNLCIFHFNSYWLEGASPQGIKWNLMIFMDFCFVS